MDAADRSVHQTCLNDHCSAQVDQAAKYARLDDAYRHASARRAFAGAHVTSKRKPEHVALHGLELVDMATHRFAQPFYI